MQRGASRRSVRNKRQRLTVSIGPLPAVPVTNIRELSPRAWVYVFPKSLLILAVFRGQTITTLLKKKP